MNTTHSPYVPQSRFHVRLVSLIVCYAICSLFVGCSGGDDPPPPYEPSASQQEALENIKRRLNEQADAISRGEGSLNGDLAQDVQSYIQQYIRGCASFATTGDTGVVGGFIPGTFQPVQQNIVAGPAVAPHLDPCIQRLAYEIAQNARGSILPLFQGASPQVIQARVQEFSAWYSQYFANPNSPLSAIAQANNPVTNASGVIPSATFPVSSSTTTGTTVASSTTSASGGSIPTSVFPAPLTSSVGVPGYSGSLFIQPVVRGFASSSSGQILSPSQLVSSP